MLFAGSELYTRIDLKLAPGYAPVPFTTLCNQINYQPLINLVPRCCTSAHLSNLFTRISFRPLRNLVSRSLTNTINFVSGWAKSTPYLSCHRDNFPAKVPGLVAGWLRQVTQPPHIAGPLCLSSSCIDS